MVGFGGGSGRWVQARTERDTKLLMDERRMRERERRSANRPQLRATTRRRLAWAGGLAAAILLVLLAL